MNDLDILMVTFDQPDYVELSLSRLLETCDDRARVWIWHNGTDAGTLEVSRGFARDPRVARFHHSVENRPLRDPINWLLETSRARYVSKVDDDCLVSPGWIETLVGAHEDVPVLGVLGSWRFAEEDFDPELARPKMAEYPPGHTVLRNFWVQGSGFVMKRRCVEQHGAIRPGQTFTQYCIHLALAGWVNGWYHPFVLEDHMDDPRSPHTRLRTDEDLRARLPLTARSNGVTTLADWEEQIRRSARASQAAPLDPRVYRGWRRTRHNLGLRARRLVGLRNRW
ncbi:MAG: glycosyltransferase family 2 protein [Acidimicrobiia bacterium]